MSSGVRADFPKDVLLLMKEVKNKRHPWRLCSRGFHYRGGTTQKFGLGTPDISPVYLPPAVWKCVRATSKKDLLHSEEIIVMSAIYFGHLSGLPKADELEFKNGNDQDWLIRGWTCYWNEVLEPKDELDANIVKALIASESSFKVSPKKTLGKGLMQLRESTRRILSDEKGEIKDHYIICNKKDILDPSTNICAGIRWLHHKQKLTSKKMGRLATWEEAVADYKSYLKEYIKNPSHRGMGTFRKYYERLSE